MGEKDVQKMSPAELKAEVVKLRTKIKARASHDDSRAAELDKDLVAARAAHREEATALKKQLGDRIADLKKALEEETARYRDDTTALKKRADDADAKALAAQNSATASERNLSRARRALGED